MNQLQCILSSVVYGVIYMPSNLLQLFAKRMRVESKKKETEGQQRLQQIVTAIWQKKNLHTHKYQERESERETENKKIMENWIWIKLRVRARTKA